MMTAAIIAAAFAEPDPKCLVEIGLSEIPSTCRLAEAVRTALSWLDDCPTFETFMERDEARFGSLHPTHAVNNALVVIMALHYGQGELDRTRLHHRRPSRKTKPRERARASLNDTIRPHVIGYENLAMSALAVRTLAARNALCQ
jgi:hypothetical protein